MLPQCSTTSGGLGFFWPALSSVGTQQLNSFSTPRPRCRPAAGGVEEHLHGELARLGPGELRRRRLLGALGGLALPLGRLGDRHFLRVELEVDAVRSAPGWQPPWRRVGSYSSSSSPSPCCGRPTLPRRRRRRRRRTRPPPALPVRAIGLVICWPPSGQEPVVGELEGLGGDLRRVEVEARARSSAPGSRREAQLATTLRVRGHRRDAGGLAGRPRWRSSISHVGDLVGCPCRPAGTA